MTLSRFTAADNSLDELLHRALSEGLRWLGLPETVATAQDIADLPLPPLSSSDADQAMIRAMSPLYLASELERAGLLAAVEELAAVWASGGLPLSRDTATDRLAAFWRGRGERFSAGERQALFARVFGASGRPALAGAAPANQEFTLRMLDLTEALSRAGEEANPWGGPTPRLEAEVRLRARQLAENLSQHGNSFVLYAASDILNAVKAGLEILKELAAQHLWGSRDLWSLLRVLHQRRRRDAPDVPNHLRRGQAGLTLLGWLADVLVHLESGAQPLLPPPAEVAIAAAAWIQTSVVLEGAARTTLAQAA